MGELVQLGLLVQNESGVARRGRRVVSCEFCGEAEAELRCGAALAQLGKNL